MTTNKIQPIHRRQITTAVIDRILSMIAEGYWQPGEALPAQRELAKSLGVGMSTLREALQSLQTMGVLEMRHGEGTFVSDNPNGIYERLIDISLASGEMDMQSLFEAREILETGIAYHAARRATEEQVQRLFEILEIERRQIESGQGEHLFELDFDFHRLIAEMARNRFLEQVDNTLRNALAVLLRKLPLTMEGWKLHCKVAEGIRDRKPFQALEAMRTLIEVTAARYLPYMAKTTRHIRSLDWDNDFGESQQH